VRVDGYVKMTKTLAVTENITVRGLDVATEGGGGGGSGTTYIHNQGTSSSTWVVDHNLNKFPSVTVIDSGGTNVIGEVIYLTENRIEIYFSAPFAGKAYLN
jgi:hypothetical protein